ncbi:hypothetical protein E9531_03100 [Lampropedia puyangensis]|uniref:Lipoprotein n=1 Tax=Lampropedia puyangensis TaxID=1330072 RepID=A0A4S8FA67_9BURK|nr:hypothetical protein [Lampropedia puyangensis]THU04400.1 hypothetical protein E9531_03100 [Lampropedia puyangensis]
MAKTSIQHWRNRTLILACAAALAACGGGSNGVIEVTPPDDGEEPHEHEPVASAGRLIALDANSAQVHAIDLENSSVLQSFTADYAPSALYASPGQRYAVLLQRNQNQAQFIDGGIWQEDHGDHLHDYEQAPALLNLRLSGVRPTHYETHEDKAALFFDGDASIGDKASIALFSDASIGSGQSAVVEASHTLDSAMHGTAEPRGDWLLTTWKPVDATSTSPTHVELHHRHGDHFHMEKRFEQECPGLHGSYSNVRYSVFGCTDGVLVIEQNGDTFTARKVANPATMPSGVRIGTIIGNTHYDKFVGIASPGWLYEIDPEAGTITTIDWAEGRTRRAHVLDAQGENLLVLDDLGSLHILDVHTWAKRAEIASAVAQMPSAAPFPSLAVSQAAETAWLSDPNGQRLTAIDLHDAKLGDSIALNFSPTSIVWLGVAEASTDHGHNH